MTDPDGWFAELPARHRDPAELAAALLQAADQLQSTVLEVVIKQHELRMLLHVVAQQLTQAERGGEAK
jgi:hypothetical protein